MDNIDLLKKIEEQKNLMISVATGGPRIEEKNGVYVENRTIIRTELRGRNIEDPNPFPDLWHWYGKWSSGDLPTYQSRRVFISKIYQHLIDLLNETPQIINFQPFSRVMELGNLENDINEIKTRLVSAQSEDQYKAIGLLCRELLISLAQIVYDPEIHNINDSMEISKTDAKKMLLNYVSFTLIGSSQEATRRCIRAIINLANDLTHNQSADYQRAALCVQATICLVNIIGIISGQISID